MTVLVNNVASDERHGVETLAVAEWDDRINVNLRHHFFASRAVAPMMRASGRGSVINVARLVLWLAAEDSRGCTARMWIADGGWM